MLSEVAHKGAKAKAYLSGEATSQAFYKAKTLSGGAKIASSGEANASHVFGEATSQAFYKAKALSGGTIILPLAKLMRPTPGRVRRGYLASPLQG